MERIPSNQAPSLTDLPRIGPTLATKLIAHFGSEAAVLAALQGGELDRLLEVEGVGENLALNLVGEFRQRVMEGISGSKGGQKAMEELLATPEAQAQWRSMIGLMEAFAVNQYSRNQLRLLRPFPGHGRPYIEKRHQRMRSALELYGAQDKRTLAGLREVLAPLAPLRKAKPLPRKERRVLVLGDEGSLKTYKNQQGHCRLFQAQRGEDPSQWFDFDQGVWLGGTPPVRMPQGWQYLSNDTPPHQVLPEATLSWFATNGKALQALVQLWQRLPELGTHPRLEGLGASSDYDHEELINLLDRAQPHRLEQTDERMAILAQAKRELAGFLGDTQLWVNEQIEQRIQTTSLTLEGEQILEALQHSHGRQLHGMVAAEVQPMLEEVTGEGISRAEAYLQPLGLALTDELFTPTIPRELSGSQVRELETQLEKAYQQARLQAMGELAERLESYRGAFELQMEAALELSFDLTLSDWALNYALTMPELTPEGGTGFAITGGRHLHLVKEELEGGPTVEPIAYGLGSVADHGDRQNIALLSGANSGGKTTLMELIFQTLTLAQAGLPVPAEAARVGLTQRIHLVAKATSTQSAGALERTLLELSTLIADPAPKVLLADELEAITEPGAGARIMAGLLEAAEGSNNHKDVGKEEPETSTGGSNIVLMVSHLADQIAEAMEAPIRIDGIAATGLDENSQLIVDRTPRRDHLARSTPELIIKRLLESSPEGSRQVMEKVMQKFNEQ